MKPDTVKELADKFHEPQPLNEAWGSRCGVCDLPLYRSRQGWRHRRRRLGNPRRPTGELPGQLDMFPSEPT